MLLIGVAVIAAGILATWFGSYQHAETDCSAWVDIREVATGVRLAAADITNTGGYDIVEYVVRVGQTDAASLSGRFEPGTSKSVEFILTGQDLNIAVTATADAGGGSALCEVILRTR